MTDEEILRKVIEKAEKGGFIYPSSIIAGFDRRGDEARQGKLSCGMYVDKNGILVALEQIIFDHDFAKAFFPKGNYIDEVEEYGNQELGTPFWECGLITLALSGNRLQYLKQFLDEK